MRRMSGPFIEERQVGTSASLLADVTRHLFTRFKVGKAIILTTNPRYTLPNLKKEWIKLEKMVKRELSSTLDSALIRELSDTLRAMQSLTFSSSQEKAAEVRLVDPSIYLQWPKTAETVYVIEPLNGMEYDTTLRNTKNGGLVVVYKNKKDA